MTEENENEKYPTLILAIFCLIMGLIIGFFLNEVLL